MSRRTTSRSPGRVLVPKLVTAPTAALVLTVAAALLLVPSVLAALAAPVVRLRAADGLARRQVVVLLGAAAALLAVTLLQGLLPAPVDVLTQAAAVVLLPLAIGVAVTRHRLYDLDLAVCRALVVTSLTVCLVGAYLSVFAVVQAVGQDRHVLSAALAAGATGAVIQPLGRHVAAGVDRLYFGHRAEPYVVTSHLAARLTGAGPDLAEVPAIVCSTVVGDLRLRGARLWLGTDAGPTVAATSGQVDAPDPSRLLVPPAVRRCDTAAPPSDTSRSAPATASNGCTSGTSWCSGAWPTRPRPPWPPCSCTRPCSAAGRRWWRPARASDGDCARSSTTASARPSPVCGSRSRRRRSSTDDTRAATLLASASAGVATAVAEVRTLCEGLRPAGLDDLGLPRALAALAARTEGPGLVVDVRVDERLDLDPAVEVALFRIAAEALANVGAALACPPGVPRGACRATGRAAGPRRRRGPGPRPRAAPPRGPASAWPRCGSGPRRSAGGSGWPATPVGAPSCEATLPLSVGGPT